MIVLLVLLVVRIVAGGAAAAIAIDLRLGLAAVLLLLLQCGHTVVVQAIKCLKVMRVDLCAVIATCLLLLAIQCVACGSGMWLIGQVLVV